MPWAASRNYHYIAYYCPLTVSLFDSGLHFSHGVRKELISALIYVLLVVCAIVLFYLFNQRETAGLAGAEITKPLSLIKANLSITSLSAQLNILIKGILMLLIVYSPYVALIVFYTRKIDKKNSWFFSSDRRWN